MGAGHRASASTFKVAGCLLKTRAASSRKVPQISRIPADYVPSGTSLSGYSDIRVFYENRCAVAAGVFVTKTMTNVDPRLVNR
jgi:hypothetical protein